MHKHINRRYARYTLGLLVRSLVDTALHERWGLKLYGMDERCVFYWLRALPYIPVRFTYPKLFRLIAWVLVGR